MLIRYIQVRHEPNLKPPLRSHSSPPQVPQHTQPARLGRVTKVYLVFPRISVVCASFPTNALTSTNESANDSARPSTCLKNVRKRPLSMYPAPPDQTEARKLSPV